VSEEAMPKNKTHSGTKKRVKVTGTGRLTQAPAAVAGDVAALLAEDTVLRKGIDDRVDDELLAGEVDLRYQVVGVGLGLNPGNLMTLVHLQPPGLGCQRYDEVQGVVQIARHGDVTGFPWVYSANSTPHRSWRFAE